MSFNSLLYKLLRISNDVNAIQRGPNAIGRRIGRKMVGRLAGKIMRRI
jgi:hypothetical protein